MDWHKRGRPRIKGKASVQAKMDVNDGVTGMSVMLPETETNYHAASRLARDMASWWTTRTSPDSALLPEMNVISARVEDLIRNNGPARGYRKTIIDNVVGPRVTCKPNPDQITIGRTLSDDWSRIVQGQWETFADATWFDAGGRHTFHSMTRLAMGSLVQNGEAIALPMWIIGNGRGGSSRWNTRLQMVHPARLSQPHTEPETIDFRGGIEFDQYGAPKTYHIRKTHPGEYTLTVDSFVWEPVPAEMSWGRPRVIHFYNQEDIGQTRGVAELTSVLRQFKMLDRYELEELRLAVMNSLVFAALETPLDTEGVAALFGTNEDMTGLNAYYEMLQNVQINMRGGSMPVLPPGTKMNPFVPTRPSSSVDPFTTVMLRHIASGLSIPYELLAKDFSKTNYSSARAALLEAWRYFNSVRQLVIDHWAKVIYDLWFEEAVNRGRIPDCTPDDYYNNQVAWTRAKWLFAPRGWVDPVKEAKGIQIRKDTGTTTLEDICGEQGHDWTDVLEQQQRENALAEQLGVPLPHVEKKASASGDLLDNLDANVSGGDSIGD
jgi:lambda family phage portal protein